ncbi:MAG: hypothetical protein ABR588_07055 [Sphingomicrobium sp.]
MKAPSPITVGLKQRFSKWPFTETDLSYRAFTTVFDEVIEATQLPSLLPKLSPQELISFNDAVIQFEKLFTAERVEIAASGAVLVRDVQRVLSAEERADTVVSFLIDHSGSMRGLRMISALLAVEGAIDALASAGIPNEILGFTTASWKGGNSRRAWRWAGKPRNPGRLCDLRHLIYGAANRTIRESWHLRLALRRDLLHENIDGEALIWAASRLDPIRWKRRIICFVSDGAPVDDSTLSANEDRSILVRHLEATEERLANEGIVIATLLIGGEQCREPVIFERADEPQAAGTKLIRLVRRALLPSEP